MNDATEIPETLYDAIKYFSEGDNAFNLMVDKRWPDGAFCPRCDCRKVTFMASRKVWQCKGCRKQFTVKLGTIFEDSPIGLDKWLSAFWMITNAKNGISSCELHRAIGVTQKTAWFMLHRIRLALQEGSFDKMNGTIEADETFIGAKARNMHKNVKQARGIKTGGCSMTAVMGLLERGTRDKVSRVKLEVLEGRKRPELQGHVRKYVLKGAELNTDALRSYNGLDADYIHEVIDHAQAYVRGTVHTNGLENFWSLLKRSIKGTYVSVEPFHLFRYLDEQAYRFNERKHKDGDRGRFLDGLAGVIGKGIRYAKLIGKDGQSDLLPA